MSLRPSTKTYLALSTDVKRIFGDESGVQLIDADMIRWINAAQMEIVTQNKALKAKSTITTTAGLGEYQFPPDIRIQQIESLHFDKTPIANVPFLQAEQQIIMSDPQQTEEGTPLLWYEWDGTITLWPRPDAASELALYYTAYPEDMTGDPDQLLGLPDKFYNAIRDYVLSKAYEMDEDMNASQLAEQRFRAAIDSQVEDERQSSHMSYPVIQETWY